MSVSHLVVLDGLIGCGKSSAIEVIEEMYDTDRYKVFIVEEPVEDWKSSGRLEMYYSDMHRRAFQFQIVAFHSRMKVFRKVWKEAEEYLSETDHPKEVVIFMERSIFSDYHVFGFAQYLQGIMDQKEWEDYTDIWSMWKELAPAVPTKFIFLRPSLDTVMDRLRGRGRKEEDGVEESLQTMLLVLHDRLYQHPEHSFDNGETLSKMFILETEYDYKNTQTGKRRLINEIFGIVQN